MIPLLETRMTFLEMDAPPSSLAVEKPEDVHLVREEAPDVGEYAPLFRAVGEPWLWQARLAHTREEISAIINEPTREIYYLHARGEPAPIGLLELDFSDPENANLAYFGVVPGRIGKGLGGFLMKTAIQKVWQRDPPPRRFWFNTCTFDHPGALGFYKHMGFKVYQTNVPDSFPDPRLNPGLYGGAYSLGAAPHVPLAVHSAAVNSPPRPFQP